MSPAQWAGVVILAPLVVYLLVRLGSAAYFKSKADYHQRGNNHVER